MTRTNCKAGLVQTSFSDDRDENWKNITRLLEQAADDGTVLAVLPELHNGLYFCQHEDRREFDRAESIPGPTTIMRSITSLLVTWDLSLFKPVSARSVYWCAGINGFPKLLD
jgi:predicted amidohydrolase